MSYRIYPVVPSENRCEDYLVKINGAVVETNVARVSAVPFNRRWPGHQRGLEQTELIQFVSLEMDEAIEVEIIPQKPSEQMIIRPLEFAINAEKTENGGISFRLEKPAYFVVEAYGRNCALHFFADPVLDYKIDKNDENVIYFGAGEHDVGMLHLKSNQTVFLDEGAVVYACIHAMDAENIRILGRGILDNSRNKEQILFEANEENNEMAVNNAVRLHTVQLEYCENIEIDGITIRDSLVYNIRPIACKNLNIRNVKIIGCWRYNSDGIDMHNCEDVHISDCFIRTFDDSICIKGFDCYYEGDVEQAVHEAMNHNGVCYDVFKNVLVERCVIWNDWGKCLEIGAETRAEEIFDILFRNCWLVHTSGPVLDCCNVDYADVHDVTYENISVEFEDEIPAGKIQTKDSEVYKNPDPDYRPMLMYAEVLCHPEYSAGGTRRGKNRRLTFKNVRLYGRQAPQICFKGYDKEHQCSDIRISDLYWNGEKVSKLSAEQLQIREFCENIIFE